MPSRRTVLRDPKKPVEKKPNPGNFQPGDTRINRGGRPRSFDAVRAIAQQVGDEIAMKDGQPIKWNGQAVTITENILRSMAYNPRQQELFVQIAYGKIPNDPGDRHFVLEVMYADDILAGGSDGKPEDHSA